MTRSEGMKRSGPPQRRTPLKTRSRIKPKVKDRTVWDDTRQAVSFRARGFCEVGADSCSTLGHEAHHVRMRSQGGSDDPENLLWVCRACHSFIHLHPAISYDRGWLARATA